jgi:hypothetical protein
LLGVSRGVSFIIAGVSEPVGSAINVGKKIFLVASVGTAVDTAVGSSDFKILVGILDAVAVAFASLGLLEGKALTGSFVGMTEGMAVFAASIGIPFGIRILGTLVRTSGGIVVVGINVGITVGVGVVGYTDGDCVVDTSVETVDPSVASPMRSCAVGASDWTNVGVPVDCTCVKFPNAFSGEGLSVGIPVVFDINVGIVESSVVVPLDDTDTSEGNRLSSVAVGVLVRIPLGLAVDDGAAVFTPSTEMSEGGAVSSVGILDGEFFWGTIVIGSFVAMIVGRAVLGAIAFISVSRPAKSAGKDDCGAGVVIQETAEDGALDCVELTDTMSDTKNLIVSLVNVFRILITDILVNFKIG